MRWSWALLAAMGCSPCPKDTCTVELGTFGIAEPKGFDGGPAVVYLHGFGGSVDETLDDDSIVAPFVDAGALVAVPAMDGNTWSIQGTSFGGRDAMAFHDQIREELTERFGVSTFYVTGFSLGASVAWDLDCLRSDVYDGVYSMSGHMWEPLPACEGPTTHHVHRHGTEDQTFPLEGAVYQGNQQSSLDASFGVLVERGSCEPASDDAAGCQVWTCDGGEQLVQCLGDHRHQRPEGWAEDAVERFSIGG